MIKKVTQKNPKTKLIMKTMKRRAYASNSIFTNMAKKKFKINNLLLIVGACQCELINKGKNQTQFKECIPGTQ